MRSTWAALAFMTLIVAGCGGNGGGGDTGAPTTLRAAANQAVIRALRLDAVGGDPYMGGSLKRSVPAAIPPAAVHDSDKGVWSKWSYLYEDLEPPDGISPWTVITVEAKHYADAGLTTPCGSFKSVMDSSTLRGDETLDVVESITSGPWSGASYKWKSVTSLGGSITPDTTAEASHPSFGKVKAVIGEGRYDVTWEHDGVRDSYQKTGSSEPIVAVLAAGATVEINGTEGLVKDSSGKTLAVIASSADSVTVDWTDGEDFTSAIAPG